MSLTTDRFKRGSAPGRARSEDQRPASFQKGHKKLGGRQRGTPNKFSAEFKNQILEAAYRIGEDANGTGGIVGYFRWIAEFHPRIMCSLLGSVMGLQELEIERPQKACPTLEEVDDAITAQIGQSQRGSGEPLSATPKGGPNSHRTSPKSKERMQNNTQWPDIDLLWPWTGRDATDLPWAWTGRQIPVGPLMHLAITDPKEFCNLLQAVLPRSTASQARRC